MTSGKGYRNLPAWLFFSALATFLAGIVSLGIGPAWLSPAEVVRTLFGGGSRVDEAIVLQIRIPRVALGMLVGASLGVSGAAMQGLFRNPMADPYLVGVSPGAALGAVVATVFGASFGLFGLSAVPLAAFSGGLLAAFVVVALSRRGGRFPVADLLLVGLAVGSFAGALYAFLLLSLNSERLASVVFWLLGSLAPADWGRVAAALPYLLVASAGLIFLSKELDVFSLGEEEAGYLGLKTERLKLFVIALAALAASAAVAVSGVIGFVGLVVPHVVRLFAGPRHAALLPLSGLWGAALLTLADAAARTVVSGVEVPVGVVTALVGAPFFVYLLYRNRKDAGP